MFVIAAEISLAGTRIVAADAHGNPLTVRTVSWHANPEVFLGRVRAGIAALIEKFAERRLLGISVGVPGTLNRSGEVVVAAENLGWFNIDAVRILSSGLPERVILENDAKLAAFAERWFCPPGSPYLKDFVFVATRGGVGTGVFVNGELLRGASGEASEFGHTILYPDGRPCICGGRGCWEEYASDRALVRMYTDQEASASGISAEEIIARARTGEPHALSVLNETALHVGLGFVNLRQVFDPEVIIVGNYLAEAWDLMGDAVWNVLRSRIAQRYLDGLRIIPARHAEDATLRGAMAVVLSRFFGSAGTPALIPRSSPSRLAAAN
jgi:predicted NBD/HSP70 family sugar kinase